MIVRLAVRSLVTRPLRSAVLSIGFGLSIAVMAELLGVGEVILEQAHSPALSGGGDIVLTGTIGPIDSARFVLTSVLASPALAPRVAAASPTRRGTVYLLSGNAGGPIAVRGGIPSRERAVGDPETAGVPAWADEPADALWIDAAPGDLLRAMDRFHPTPDSPQIASTDGPGSEAGGVARSSWAEWLYFNARSTDGLRRFYLTFITGPPAASGMRPAYVRLQLNQGGTTRNFSARGFVGDRELLDRAPDVDIAGNRVRVEPDGRYRITLALDTDTGNPNPSSGLSGELVLTPAAGRSIPPATIRGARGWLSGYVVPVLSGAFTGTLHAGTEAIDASGMAGYHDHNWGYWEGVRWQWGQVTDGTTSIIYGRVFPPADVADPARVPGVLGVIGADGPIGFSTDVAIREDDDNGRPRTLTIESRDRRLDMTLRLEVSETVQTAMALTRDAAGSTMTFLQLGGVYRVTGRVAGREINFSARGSAETFRATTQ
ncbi:MAG TPA: hypothetical protein VKE96_09050 [Vicinamibacterales bacterium]|nr:hypothetical protein [Vicinamibacterales bacterium]